MEIDLSDLFSDVNQVNEYLKANSNIGEDLDLNDVFGRLEDAALSGWQTRDRIREVVQDQIIHELGLTKKEEKVAEVSSVPKSNLLDNVVKPSIDFLEYAVKPSKDLLDNAVEPPIATESVTKNKRKRAELTLFRKPHMEVKKLKICKFASASLFGDVQNTMMTSNENQTATLETNDERRATSSKQMDGNVTESQFQQKPNVAEVICNDVLKLNTPKHISNNDAIKVNVNPGDRMDEAFIVVSDNGDEEDDLAVVGMVGPMNKGSSVIPHPSSSTASVDTAVSSTSSYSGSTSSSSASSSTASVAPTNAAKFSEASLKLRQIKADFSNARKRFRCIRNRNTNKSDDKKMKKDKKKANSFQGESSSKSKMSKKPSFTKMNTKKNKVKLVSPRPSTGGSSIPLDAHRNLDIASSPGPSKACSKESSKASSPGPSKVCSKESSKASSPGPSKACSKESSKASSPGPSKASSLRPSKARTISNILTRSKSVISSSSSGGNSDTIRCFTRFGNDISGAEDVAKQLEEMFPHFSPEYLLNKAKQYVTIENTIDELLNEAAVEDSPQLNADEMKYVKERVAKSLLLLGEEDMFKKVNLTEKRDFNPDDPLENKFRLAKGHYLNVSGKFASPIESIDYVENRALLENFERKKIEFKAEGKDTKEYFLFHGTNDVNVDSILKQNFRMDFAGKHGDVHGRGIYFSEKTIIPNQYMSGSKKTLLLCRVLLGREFLGLEKDIPAGFDSKSVLPDEEKRANINIIKEVDQILPCFVLNLAPSNGPGQFRTQLMKSGHVKTIIIKKLDKNSNLTKK